MASVQNSPTQQTIIRVEIGRLPSDKKTSPDKLHPLSSSSSFSSSFPTPQPAADEAAGARVNGWAGAGERGQHRPLSSSCSRSHVGRPPSGRRAGGTRPQSSRGRAECGPNPKPKPPPPPPSSREPSGRWDARPLSRPPSRVELSPYDSRSAASRLDNNNNNNSSISSNSRRPHSSGSGGNPSARRPASSPPWTRTPNPQPRTTTTTTSDQCSDLLRGERLSPSGPRSSDQTRPSSSYSFFRSSSRRKKNQSSRRPATAASSRRRRTSPRGGRHHLHTQNGGVGQASPRSLSPPQEASSSFRRRRRRRGCNQFFRRSTTTSPRPARSRTEGGASQRRARDHSSSSGGGGHASPRAQSPGERASSCPDRSPENGWGRGRGRVAGKGQRGGGGAGGGAGGVEEERRHGSSQPRVGRVASASHASRSAGGGGGGGGGRDGGGGGGGGGSATGSIRKTKARPWTAPVSGRERRRGGGDNVQEDYHHRTGVGSWMAPGQQYSDETKRKQEEIIRRILEEFDLEETMQKYRNSNACSIRREGKSLADFRFRSELMRMMGSDEIRLNDQNWSKRFQQNLYKEYEKYLDQQAQNLAQAETQRLHRLRVQGIIQEESSSKKDSDAFGKHRLSLGGGGGKKKADRPGDEGPDSSRTTESPATKPIFDDEESETRQKAMLETRQESLYQPSEDVHTQMARLKRTDDERVRPDREKGHPDAPSSDVSEDSQDFDSGSLFMEEDDQAERRKKRYRHLPPKIAQLYEEESIPGLYKMAEGLLGTPTSGKKKKTVSVGKAPEGGE
ncbi:uncharacterized protein LOC143289891 [Babylonia areolata]|uniref:uncharacterized protein LOC143289891 n=1 Tax=Babylonia areolata TaxID=304850 RepID=UPI003FD1A1F9